MILFIQANALKGVNIVMFKKLDRSELLKFMAIATLVVHIVGDITGC